MGHHILCVDELEVTRIELSEMLKKFDIQVSSVRNEVEAVNYLINQKNKVNALVWTISTIDLSGFESIKRIKSNAVFKELPVIIVSKFTDRKYVIKAIEAGACEYIAKPYDRVTAVKKICTILGMPFEDNKSSRQDEDIAMFNFNEMLTREVKSASRGKHVLTIMMLAVASKTKGNEYTDCNEIIEIIFKVIKLKLRETDTIYIYGEDKLAILLPFSGKDGAIVVEKKIRNIFETNSLIKKKNEGYALAISFVTLPDDGKVKEKLLEKLEDDLKKAVKGNS